MEATSTAWPADVIHVNEDGWVLINRGWAHGVAPGQRLFVVGSTMRELRDLFGVSDGAAPIVLRTRRTYEMLEIVHAEERCAIAVAARAPAARRPKFYHGLTGELLVWVPLPDDYTWPPPPEAAEDASGADAESAADDADVGDDDDSTEVAGADDASAEADANADSPDDPPARGDQEDVRWEEALPLNGVSVGDIVVPAVPAGDAMSAAVVVASPTVAAPASASSATPDGSDHPHWDQQYDWMQPRPNT